MEVIALADRRRGRARRRGASQAAAWAAAQGARREKEKRERGSIFKKKVRRRELIKEICWPARIDTTNILAGRREG
jgi:hypothetical protein